MNRESWLMEVAKRAEPFFNGLKLHPYKLTCSWPSRNATSNRARRLGECHGPDQSKAGLFEIFISPLLDDPLEVAGTAMHELAHVAAGIKAGHGKEFIKVCRHVGLTKGRPTSIMPGEHLNEALTKIIEVQGAYPHQGIKAVERKVATRFSGVTLVCACGCTLRIGMKWLEQAGVPTCGCGGEMRAKLE